MLLRRQRQRQSTYLWNSNLSVIIINPSQPESGKIHSVQERGLWCTEYAFGAKKGLLVYARRFLRHSVQKTGFYGTELRMTSKSVKTFSPLW